MVVGGNSVFQLFTKHVRLDRSGNNGVMLYRRCDEFLPGGLAPMFNSPSLSLFSNTTKEIILSGRWTVRHPDVGLTNTMSTLAV